VSFHAIFSVFFVSFLFCFLAQSPAEELRQGRSKKHAPTQAATPVRLTKVGQSRPGIASWYGPGLHGRRTASGEVFNAHKLTAAHRTLPLGTRLSVTNLSNGKSVVVRVNDRGPRVKRRLIDLSYAAARAIGLVKMGKGKVKITVLSIPK
jgi:rare lipoprotein A (peptidoglycan hydrolase)